MELKLCLVSLFESQMVENFDLGKEFLGGEEIIYPCRHYSKHGTTDDGTSMKSQYLAKMSSNGIAQMSIVLDFRIQCWILTGQTQVQGPDQL